MAKNNYIKYCPLCKQPCVKLRVHIRLKHKLTSEEVDKLLYEKNKV